MLLNFFTEKLEKFSKFHFNFFIKMLKHILHIQKWKFLSVKSVIWTFYIVGEIAVFSLQNNLKYNEMKNEAAMHVRQFIRSVHINIQITYFCCVN